ncbi:MAG: hypothetical protein AAF573_19345 [Bacteroidota bacterium]
MKNSSKDNFEQFFKKSLEDYQEHPPDDFWSEMENRIPPPPAAEFSFWKKTGGWRVLIVLLGVLLVGGWQWWQQQKDVSSIHETIYLQNERIEKVEAQLDEVVLKRKDKKSNENLPIEREMDFMSMEKQNSGNDNYNGNDNGNGNGNDNGNDNDNDNDNVSEANKVFAFREGTLALEKDRLKSSTDNFGESRVNSSVEADNDTLLAMEKIESAESIPSLVFEVASSQGKCLTCIEDQLRLKLAPNKKRGLEIFINASQLFPKLDLINSGYKVDFKKGRDYDFGLLYHIPIHRKWSIQLGFGVGNNNISTRFQKAFSYNDNENYITDDTYRTNYFYQLNTNYDGIVNFTTYLNNEKQNDGQDVLIGDAFTTEIQINKRQRYLTVPFFVKHQWYQGQGKLNWTWKLGVIQRLSYIYGESLSVNIDNFSNPRLSHHTTTIVDVGGAEEKRFDTTIIFSAGGEYLIFRNVALVLEPTLKQALTQRGDIRQTAFGFYMGIRWSFKP